MLLCQWFAGEDAPDDPVDVVWVQANHDSGFAHVAEESSREPAEDWVLSLSDKSAT